MYFVTVGESGTVWSVEHILLVLLCETTFLVAERGRSVFVFLSGGKKVSSYIYRVITLVVVQPWELLLSLQNGRASH